jgi:hypothetical protein
MDIGSITYIRVRAGTIDARELYQSLRVLSQSIVDIEHYINNIR